MSLSAVTLYDFAGFDGLALAREVFGPWVPELAVYQSRDTEWSGRPCALLRLCENNFRVGVYGGSPDLEGALTEAAGEQRVWVKPTGLVSLFLQADWEWERLAMTATTKAPHRLAGMPIGYAVPARVENRAVLVWRHCVSSREIMEIQTAHADCSAVEQYLRDR